MVALVEGGMESSVVVLLEREEEPLDMAYRMRMPTSESTRHFREQQQKNACKEMGQRPR